MDELYLLFQICHQDYLNYTDSYHDNMILMPVNILGKKIITCENTIESYLNADIIPNLHYFYVQGLTEPLLRLISKDLIT